MKNPIKFQKKEVAISLLFMILLFFLLCCKKEESQADENDMRLVGQWEITRMTTIYLGETEITTESQLDSIGIVWRYEFDNDNTVKLTTNISGPIVTMPGTWSTSLDQLTLILTDPTGSPATLIYEYFIGGNILKLDWEIPSGTKYFGEFTKQ
jgi:hypothetical protein